MHSPTIARVGKVARRSLPQGDGGVVKSGVDPVLYAGCVPKEPRPEVSVSTTRAKVLHASDPAVGALARLPQWMVLAGFAVLMVIGVIVRGPIGAVCFGVVTLVLAWLLYVSWTQLRPMDRLARAAALCLTLAVTIVMAVPK